MASCPCKRRKADSFVISCSQNCKFNSWHTDCAGFLNIVCKKQVDDMGQWNCPYCVVKALHIPLQSANEGNIISELDEKLESLKSEICDLRDIKQDLADIVHQNEEGKRLWSDIVRNGVPNSVDTNHEKAEKFASKIADQVVQKSNEVMYDRDAKEKNVIMFNVVESTQGNITEKRKDDQDFLAHFCEQIKLQPLQTRKIVRIGKIKAPPENNQDEATPKPRPLKVCFNSVFDKRMFLSNLYHLKNAVDPFKSVQVNHDLTDEDRSLTKQLLKEAYDKNQSEKPEAFLYKVRGPPGAIKVVKVYHRH